MVAEQPTRIGDISALRALADPLRLRVVDLLGEAPRTVKELSAVLDVPRTRLHYHVNVLEKHGFIRVASTRVVNGATERSYEPTGRSFEAHDLPMPPQAAAGIASVLETAAHEVGEQLRSAKRSRTTVGTAHLRVTEARHLELSQRLESLIEEFEHDDEGDAVTVVFALYGADR